MSDYQKWEYLSPFKPANIPLFPLCLNIGSEGHDLVGAGAITELHHSKSGTDLDL